MSGVRAAINFLTGSYPVRCVTRSDIGRNMEVAEACQTDKVAYS